MGKIVFFEDKNFQGRCYECRSNCSDLHSYFSRCNSIRVESGCWVLYEHPNYTGHQYILNPGDYPDHQQWMGFNDRIRSCRSIQNVSPWAVENLIQPCQTEAISFDNTTVYGNSWKIRFYDKEDFGGQMAEWSEDCPSVNDTFKFNELHSCVVLDGAWVLYEQPNYQGQQYFLERREYQKYSDWGANSPAVGSFRRITEF